MNQTRQSPPALPQTRSPTGVDRPDPKSPTIWGLSPRQLHDAFWTARGVQPVRRGEAAPLQRAADLYLLIEPDQLAIFDLASLSDRLTWRRAAVTRLRLIDQDVQHYSEQVILDERGLVQRIERRYRPQSHRSYRVALTPNRRLARLWIAATSARIGWDRVRRAVAWSRVDHWRCPGAVFDEGDPQQVCRFLDTLVETWTCPAQSIEGIDEIEPGVWRLADQVPVDDAVRLGPLWLGWTTTPTEQRCLIGPGWTADAGELDHLAPSPATRRDISQVEPSETDRQPGVITRPWTYRVIKRAVDVGFSAVVLIALLPLFGLIGLMIWLEDGRPILFAHRRQGRHGRVFRCLKFRTMQVDAHQVARQLDTYNLCDGPQVFIRDDPRVTRIGRVLRRTNLDELPQFFNVLRGEMSVVGPRPSPDDENQYCPAWRDVRLSVRPGITGLWQLKRRREPGEDFQEWIKYDIQYVQRAGLKLDISIMLRTMVVMLTGRGSTCD